MGIHTECKFEADDVFAGAGMTDDGLAGESERRGRKSWQVRKGNKRRGKIGWSLADWKY
jgi:hypothetical protein